ncbi:MAG: rRNA maturation RNase YbeY [Methylococcales bacterium]|nr:rRNA maturation RNase YbeY [Methylococcales bacterium]
MNVLDLQLVSESKNLPSQDQFQYWVDSVLKDDSQDSEIVIRVVDEDEMTQFNEQYRNKTGSTNILSFPFDAPDAVESDLLGDLLVCAAVVEREAQQQDKILEHHWAHMIVHGVLHLLGYDHINDQDAEEMEALEVKILKTIKINNPYEEKSRK